MARRNNFEGLKQAGTLLVDEDTLATTNTSDGTSAEGGGANDIFNVVTIGASRTLKVDSGQKAHGSFSMRLESPANNSNSCFGEYTGQESDIPTPSIPSEKMSRFYFRCSALPANVISIVRFRDASNVNLGSIRLTNTGVLRYQDVGATNRDVASLVIAANTWYRIEYRHKINTTTTGEFEFRVWTGANLDSTGTADYINNFTAINAGATVKGKTAFGDPIGVTLSTTVTVDFWFDDVRIGEAAWIGPPIQTYSKDIATNTITAPLIGKTITKVFTT